MGDEPRVLTEQMVAEHQRMLLRTVRFLGVRSQDVNDVVQEVFLQATRSIATWRGEGALSTWLYKIAINVVRNRRRRSQRDRSVPTSPMQLPALSDEAASVGSLSFRSVGVEGEERRYHAELLAKLPEDERELFVLVWLEQLTLPEAAGVLGLSVADAKVKDRSVRERLQRIEQEREPL